MYLHEPSCRKFIYPAAKWRVNRKRPECPEDVLVLENMRKAAVSLGFRLDVNYSTATVNRGVVEGVYYKALYTFPLSARGSPVRLISSLRRCEISC